MANGNGNRLAFLRNTGNFMKRAGPRGNLANRMGFDDDERDYFAPSRTYGGPSSLSDDSLEETILENLKPGTDFIGPPAMDSMADFDLTLGSGTGPESPSDVSTSSTRVPSKMALTAADEFMLSPGEIDFSPTAMAAPPMPEKRVFEETTPAEGPRSFWDKIGGGIKGALTSPGVGDALIATGTRVMSEGFGGLGEGLREGVAELEVGRQEKKYKDTINDLGKYLTEEERQIAHAMPEGQGFTYLREKMEGAEGEAARARALVETLGMSPEAAAIMAKDATISDRAMAGGRQVEMIQDDTGQSYLIDLATKEQVAGPFGTEVPNLDRERLALGYAQLDATNKARYLSPMFADVVSTYADVKPLVDGSKQIAEAIDLLSNDQVGKVGTFAEFRQAANKLLDTTGAELTGNLQNILQDIGISNLGRFKGAISEKELATALNAAGTIEALRGTLNDILARNLESRLLAASGLQAKSERLVQEGVLVADEYGLDAEELQLMKETAELARSRGSGSVLGAATGGDTRTMQLPPRMYGT